MKLIALAAAVLVGASVAGNARAGTLPSSSSGLTQCGTGAALGSYASNQVIGGDPMAEAVHKGDYVATAVVLYRWDGSQWATQTVVWMWTQTGPDELVQQWNGFDGTDYGTSGGGGIVNGVVFNSLAPGYYYVRDWFYWYASGQWGTSYDPSPTGSGSNGSFYCSIGG